MQTPVPYGSKLHIPLTNYNLLAAQQELYKKGGAATCQLDINSNTCAHQDMHGHGMHERCRHTITEAEKKTLPIFTTTCVQGMECRVDLDRALSLI